MEDSNDFIVSKPLDVSVLYWGSGVISGTSLPSSVAGLKDANKAKSCELHPLRTLVISADRRQVVTVWDYIKKEVIMQRHISDIGISANLAVNRHIHRVNAGGGVRQSSSFNFLRDKSYAQARPPLQQTSETRLPSVAVVPENIVRVSFVDKHAGNMNLHKA